MRNKRLIIIFAILCVVTVFVVLTSIVFRVNHIEVVCYNYEGDDEFNARIASRAGELMKGDSIFLLKPDEVIAKIESEHPDAKIINIERIFPNRAKINVVKKVPFAYVTVGEDDLKYYVLDNDLVVYDVMTTQPDIYPAAAPDGSLGIKLIRINLSGNGAEPLELLEGDGFQTSGGVAEDKLRDAFLMLQRLDYTATELIEDMTVSDSNDIMLMSLSGGVTMRVIGDDRIQDKVHLGMSVYTQGDEFRVEGTTIHVYYDAAEGMVTAALRDPFLEDE